MVLTRLTSSPALAAANPMAPRLLGGLFGGLSGRF
jgi:hypothetical protein